MRGKVIMKKILKDWIMPILLAIMIAIVINKVLFFNVYVPTPSMVPTINKDGQAFSNTYT